MFLKTQTDYALRTLLYLAHVQGRSSVDRIAVAYRISREHLVKVVQQLVRLGYVRTYSGRYGGIELAKRPEEMNVGAVIGEFEGRNGVLECVANPDSCVLEPGCVLRHLLIEAEKAFYQTLARASIADLIRSNTAKQSGGIFNLTVAGAQIAAPAGGGTGEGALGATGA
jgi:Rrf2 family transcriptional regulator, nitric oxide-sensitive transcriptional repressor